MVLSPTALGNELESERTRKAGLDEAIMLARDVLAGRMRKIISATTSYIILCYGVGWWSTLNYLSAFDAAWLIREIAPLDFLTRGWVGLIFLLGMVVIVFSDVFTRRLTPQSWGILILLAITIVLALTWVEIDFGRKLSPRVLLYATRIQAGFLGLLIGCLMINMLALFRTDLGILDHAALRIVVYILTIAGLIVVPARLGIAEARVDLHPSYSSLPVVVTREANASSPLLRMLLTAGEHIYAVNLTPQGAPPEIIVITWDKVFSIRQQQGEKNR